MKQASRCWHIDIDGFLTNNMEMKSLFSTHCIYLKKISDTQWLVIILYVDDLLICSNSDEAIDEAFRQLGKWNIRKLDSLDHYLGMTITEMDNHLLCNQPNAIKKLIDFLDISDRRPTSSPRNPNFKILPRVDDEQKCEQKIYRSAIGQLNWIARISRPDILFHVMLLSQHQNDPSILHWEAARHLGRYLAGTIEMGVPISKNGGTKLTTFADSSFLDQQVKFHSSTGYAVFLGDTLITWASKKQPTVALSSAEAEFIAATEAVKEILWTRNVLSEIEEILPQWKLDGQPTLAIDSRACQDMINNGCFEHGRTKHISYRMQFIFEESKRGAFQTTWIKGTTNVADILTKSDPSLVHFNSMRNALMVRGNEKHEIPNIA